MVNFLIQLVEFIIALIDDLGYLGIFIGMTIESSIIPFPAELILPPAGALIARGQMSFVIVLAMAIGGSILGALINYYLAFYLGRKTVNKVLLKYGKIFMIKKEELIKSEVMFHKHGDAATFFGRLIPGIRSFVSLPAGFYKMNLAKFTFFTGLGAGIWSAILIYLGIIYSENIDKIKENTNEIALIIIGIVVIIMILYFFIKKLRKGNNFPPHLKK